VRLPVVLVALALLAAGCSAEQQSAPATTHAVPAELNPPPAPPQKRSKVHVIVFDGDGSLLDNTLAVNATYSVNGQVVTIPSNQPAGRLSSR
jgi:type IV pilus biogenesis protein CpaD/CtpE